MLLLRPTLCRLLLLCLLGSGAAVADELIEELRYHVAYRGFFSAGKQIDIGDAVLRTLRPGRVPSVDVMVTELLASSAAYPVVETVFPFRYRLRSWYRPGSVAGLAHESCQQTRKLRHRLYLPLGGDKVERRDLRGKDGGELLQALEAGDIPRLHDLVPAFAELDAAGLLDRLALLQQVRHAELTVGEVLNVGVAGVGQDYRISVEAATELPWGERTVAAWQLRFDGREQAVDGTWQPAHRPVFVWLSQGPERQPLRVESRHSLGRFVLDLVPPGDATGTGAAAIECSAPPDLSGSVVAES